MRIKFLLILLALGGAVPAAAQPQQPNLERRINRIEQELRAVQRRVFPGGAAATIDPELQPQAPAATTNPAAGTSNALSALTSRISDLEAQLARVTGQVEESGFRIGQIEEQVRQLRTDTEARIARLEQQAAAAAPPAAAEPAATEPEPEPAGGQAAEPEASTPEPAAEPSRSTAGSPEGRPLDRAQAAYNAGFRLWEEGRHAEAAAALTQVAQRHPNSRWASWARNLAGRAHLDDGKPANAARVFLENYQANPQGERAADSLFFLGEALVKLDRKAEACPVYDELASKYPTMRAFLRERLPAARRAAGCS